MSRPAGTVLATGDPVHPRVPRPAPADAVHWPPPSGPTTRGTIVLLPGRGEHPGVYERFGRRLAADAYAVHVLSTTSDASPADIAARVDALAITATAPLVLAGSDTGALLALTAAARTTTRPAALLLAGVPAVPGPGSTDSADPSASADGSRTAHGDAPFTDPTNSPDSTATAGPVANADTYSSRTAQSGDAPFTGSTNSPDAAATTPWTDELDARTSCPAHRGRLSADPLFVPGALAGPVPEGLPVAAGEAVAGLGGLPVLVVHGGADPVAPVAVGRAVAGAFAAGTLAVVADGRHDAFNDLQHRSVAALVVQWLERLRGGGAGPVLDVEGTPVP
ncbi:alpha/beta hydrolase [Actinacidiphila acididurans]|uniref:Alpha/beta hydrolase n=1 Tax=Actinacidiphila acididurans TaxID=2784346 RepID=A0ABS2TXP8_9ACTN|nr:alpha/beta hydrolase [Actinacidiphila acididurans]MBM9508127.1 alpha/beta hydrolase [Actinacidiphila acididurans]